MCQYYRFSVGGMTDVAEIKGHRSDVTDSCFYYLLIDIFSFTFSHFITDFTCNWSINIAVVKYRNK